MKRLGACLGLLVGSAMSFGQWTATILSSSGFVSAASTSIGSPGSVGSGMMNDDTSHALMWGSGGTSFIDLHPAAYLSSWANGASGPIQVGAVDTFDHQLHAVMWQGTAASVVDLNPVNWATVGYGCSETSQVGRGWGGDMTSDGSAVLWHGSANSMVVLGPDDVWSSEAFAASDHSQAGNVRTNNGNYYAALWHDTKESLVNLNPTWAGESFARGVLGDQIVGGSRIYDAFENYVTHATLWNGTAASAIDLNPEGFENSAALAIAGGYQVGFGRATSTGNLAHAMVWQGTAGSMIDLSELLPLDYNSSIAYGVTADGTIVGSAYDENGYMQAVRWSPVPEPNSLIVLGFGSLIVLRRRKKLS